MDSGAVALVIIGATLALTGAFMFRRSPVVFRSIYLTLPFSVVYLVAVLHPFLFGGAHVDSHTAPARIVLFFLWALILMLWDLLMGDVHAVNVDRYAVYDAVTESLVAAKLSSTYERGGDGVVKVGSFTVPVMDATIKVTYFAPLRYAVLRFHQHGVRGFDRDLAERIEAAIGGKPATGQSGLTALTVLVGALLVLAAVALAA